MLTEKHVATTKKVGLLPGRVTGKNVTGKIVTDKRVRDKIGTDKSVTVKSGSDKIVAYKSVTNKSWIEKSVTNKSDKKNGCYASVIRLRKTDNSQLFSHC